MTRRILPLLLALAVLALSACGADTQTHGEMTISLPEGFVELSGENYAADFDFLYQNSTVAVAGIRETKAALPVHDGPPTVQYFAEMLMDHNHLP